jgi:hypothetical protein
MKRWKKVSIGLLILLVLTQIPFACRRYKLRRLNATIQQLNAQRTLPAGESVFENPYDDFAGVIHVHSFLGGHSPGGFQEIIDSARATRLSFVVMTEHPAKDFNTSEKTLSGNYGGVLFINGNEVSTRDGDRLLIIPGDEVTGESKDPAERLTTVSLLQHAEARGKLAVVAYPEDFKTWSSQSFGAIEIYNVYTDARAINPVVAFFDSIWSYRTYRSLLFASFYQRPTRSLSKFDQVAKSRKVVALAGNDAHSNVGITLSDSSGKTLLGLKLDPYETSFRLVRMHVLLPALIPRDGMRIQQPLETSSLLSGLAMGHCFIGFDFLGDSSGFNFVADNGLEQRIQGDEISLQNSVRLLVSSPLPARIVLFKDGAIIQEREGAKKQEFIVTEKGVYRVELYLSQLPHRAAAQPWVISNPIYVR